MNSLSKKVFIDIETYAPIDLTIYGARLYTNHPKFRNIIAVFSPKPHKYILVVGHKNILKKVKHYKDKGYKLIAHNASFEWECTKEVTDFKDWLLSLIHI